MTAPQPLDCVVDASVGIKLLLVEPLSDAAHAHFSGLAADPPVQLYVPDLFYIECANVLWKIVERAGLPSADAVTFIADLTALALHSTPTAALAGEALKIALAHHITAYDAAYVALAARLGLPLVTADARLAASVPQSACAVLMLGETR